jgi:hypothetical protein
MLGNMLKNLFCWARPPSPPVFRGRGKFDEEDYTFPSTHSWQAVSIPIYLTWYIFGLSGETDSTFALKWAVGVLIVSSTIATSRIYLGAHHLQDVVAGLALGATWGTTYALILSELLDSYLFSGGWKVPVVTTLILVIVILLHPNEIHLNTRLAAFNQTTSQSAYLVSSSVGGCAAGVCFGSWCEAQYPQFVYVNSLDYPLTVVTRFIVGFALIAFLYLSLRKVLRLAMLGLFLFLNVPIFDPPYKLDPTYVEKQKAELASMNIKSGNFRFTVAKNSIIHRFGLAPYFRVMMGSGIQVMPVVKFLQYFSLGWMGMFGAFVCFSYIGV